MKKSIFILMIVLMACLKVYAYDQIKVHPLINEKAALQSQNFISMLMSLGYRENPPDDILTANSINGRMIKEWLWMGGTQEDMPDCRSKYHFHDPTKTFDTAGLSNAAINTACLNWGNESSIMWSQNQGNLWSWQQGREYYYQALISTDRNLREQKFADTFRAVGQVMHLLSDASVPEHTRNDIHIFPWFDTPDQSFPQIGSWTYETWCKWNAPNLNTNVAAQDYGITNTSVVTGLIPIFNFWDTTSLPVIGSFIPVGLAEYSNYNFLSRDTIFRDYVYPEKTNHFIGTAVAEDGVTDNRIYFQGTTSDNKVINHLASTGYLWSELSQISAYTIDDSRFNLDDNCYKDYADILVPKAVSFGAGLLNYFFRGNIDITVPASGVYSSATSTNSGFTTIKVFAKNTTANSEEMPDGNIELVVKYRLALEDPFENYAEDYDFQAELYFSYIVAPEKNGVRTISRTGPVELTFDLPSELPLWAIDVYLQVVYHGRLGNEDGAVAVGFKDISEPTPVDIFNNMDKICLNGAWYTAGSPEAIAQVDTNNNGIPEWDIYPHDLNAYLKISPFGSSENASPSLYTFFVPAIHAGEFYRSYILADTEITYSDYATAITTDAQDLWTFNFYPGLWSGETVKNQVDYVEDQAECASVGENAPCYVWYYPSFYQFREKYMWSSAGIMFNNVKYPTDTNCSWELLQ